MAGANGMQLHTNRVRKPGKFWPGDWVRIILFFNSTCLRCGKETKMSKDHIVPRVLGGDETLYNLQPLCLPCNISKSGKMIDYRPEYLNMSCE